MVNFESENIKLPATGEAIDIHQKTFEQVLVPGQETDRRVRCKLYQQ